MIIRPNQVNEGEKAKAATVTQARHRQLKKHAAQQAAAIEQLTIQRDALRTALGVLLKMAEDGDFTTVELNQARAALALCNDGKASV